MARVVKVLTACFAVSLVPGVSVAQVAISGVVTHAGAPLADVTVQAASPALIEKQRTAMTDRRGRYRITNLPPGQYVITFTKDAFAPVILEDIKLTGSSAEVNQSLTVGVETVYVVAHPTGVDTRNVGSVHVIGESLADNLPVGSGALNFALLPAEVSQDTGLLRQDVGDTARSGETAVVVHGSKPADQLLMRNGLPISNMIRNQSIAFGRPAAASAEEITIDTGGISALYAQGGVRINVVPQEGGNTFSGGIVGIYADSRMQGSNYTNELEQRGLSAPGGIESNWETSADFGGPVARDHLWFRAFGRARRADFLVPDMFYNRNASNPSEWSYLPDTSRRAIVERTWFEGQVNVTLRPAPQHKVSLNYDHHVNCLCPGAIMATTAPEAARDRLDPLLRAFQGNWTYTVSNRFLLEMGANYRLEKRNFPPPAAVGPPEMIAVLEQGGAIPNLQYRAASNYTRERDETGFVRGVVTYATGSHQLTLGAGDGIGRGEAEVYSRNPLSYRFREGIPNQLTMQATPHTQVVDVDHDLGVFAEHQWTLGRLTSVFGLRYDYFANSFPDQYLGPGPLMPSRSVFFPARSNVAWHDVTPRVGLAWDVSGTGRTKVQASLGKFPAGYGTLQSGLTSDANPIALVPQTALRSWIDGNGNYQPDCDILNPADQDNRARGGDRCGALNPSNFGTSDPNKSFDPNLLRGSGKRDYNWLFAVGGEHELSRGVVLSGGYFQRQYRNFQVTDNRAVGPGDFDTFSIVAPIDSRLPGGGGNTVTGFPNVTPMLFGQVDNFVTLSSHYGEQIDLWRGVDVTLRARLANGLLVRGGVSTGRLTTDNCDIVAQSPETLQGGAALRVPIGASAWLPASFCHQESPFLTQVRAYGVYEIPTIDVLVSGVFQSLPGVPVLAQYQASRIEVQEALGRLPSGSENNVVVHLVKPGTMYGERLYQFDLRFTKVFRLGNQMLSLNADIYNLFNASTVLAQNNTFSPNPEGGPAAWQTPTEILQARLLKLGAQFRF